MEEHLQNALILRYLEVNTIYLISVLTSTYHVFLIKGSLEKDNVKAKSLQHG